MLVGMTWLSDPGDRKGADLVAYRIGNFLALLIVCAVVAVPLAWWLVQVLR